MFEHDNLKIRGQFLHYAELQVEHALHGLDIGALGFGFVDRVFSFVASLNARFNDPNPVHLGPGVAVGLPIFNRNQGRISRVKAEMEKASWQYLALRQTVGLDVRESYALYKQATRSVELWERSYLPSLQDALRRSTNAFVNGDFPYVQVAETTRQLLDARQRAAEARADQRRALARLRYSVGGARF